MTPRGTLSDGWLGAVLLVLSITLSTACGDQGEGPEPGRHGAADGTNNGTGSRDAIAAPVRESARADTGVEDGQPVDGQAADGDDVAAQAGDPFRSAPLPIASSEAVALAALPDHMAALALEPTSARTAARELVLPGGSTRASLRFPGPLRLAGNAQRPTIQGADGPAITVTGGRVELVGLVLSAPGEGPAIVVERGTLVLSGGVVLSAGGDGVVLTGPEARLEVHDTLFTTGRGAGVRASAGAVVDCDNAEFVGCAVGIALDGGALRARGGRFGHGDRGILAREALRLELTDTVLLSHADVALDVTAGELRLSRVEVRAPGGVPGLRLTGVGDAVIADCVILGTPAEADHHAAEITREHLVPEVMAGIDHHLLGSLIELRDGASPTITDCEVRGALGSGISWRDAGGQLSRVTVTGSVFYGLLLDDRARPELFDCRIEDSGENGLFARDHALAWLTRCDLIENGRYSSADAAWPQVALTRGAITMLRDCTLTGGGAAGVEVTGAGSQVGLADCQVSGSAGIGVDVSNGGVALLVDSQVQGHGGEGVRLRDGGRAELTGCAVKDNGGIGVRVDTAADGQLANCEITANRRQGVVFADGSRGRLQAVGATGNRGEQVEVFPGADVEVVDG